LLQHSLKVKKGRLQNIFSAFESWANTIC
jgi:hypothetical protein